MKKLYLYKAGEESDWRNPYFLETTQATKYTGYGHKLIGEVQLNEWSRDFFNALDCLDATTCAVPHG